VENQRLRRAVSDLTLDKLILTEAARGNVCMVRPGCASMILVCAEHLRQCIRPLCGADWLRASMGIRMPDEAFY
jgi:hypothetical protein